MMHNILILSAGRRVELLQAFRKEIVGRGMGACLYAADCLPELSSACQLADAAWPVPRASDPEFGESLLTLCKEQEIGLVIPTIDSELQTLAGLRESFLNNGINIVVSDPKFIANCRDKRRTATIFSRLGIGTPAIYSREDIRFPCFAKPYNGSCSVGSIALSGPEDLSESIITDDSIMFMEFVDRTHAEYTVDAYYDRNGKLACFVPRERLAVRGGEVSKGITHKGFVYDYLLSRLRNIHGARGCITLQLFAREADAYFAALEINPRFGGGFPLSYQAGARYPGWLIDEYLFDREIVFFEGWEPNLTMLRYDAAVYVHGKR